LAEQNRSKHIYNKTSTKQIGKIFVEKKKKNMVENHFNLYSNNKIICNRPDVISW